MPFIRLIGPHTQISPIFAVVVRQLTSFMSENNTDLPPFVRTWSQLYAIVIGSLVVEIILFYALMRWLS